MKSLVLESYATQINSYAQYKLDIDSGKLRRNSAEEIDRYKSVVDAASPLHLGIDDINIDINKAKELLKNGNEFKPHN